MSLRPSGLICSNSASSLRTRLGIKLGVYVYKIGDGICSHLSHHLASMCFHGDLADTKFATNLFIHQSANDERHDLLFTAAKDA